LASEHLSKIVVWPNLLDTKYLIESNKRDQFKWGAQTPVLWIGRFDNQKNVNDYLRCLSLLPSDYHGVAVVSLNDEGGSFADFMGDVYAYRLQDRISILLNLSKRQMRALYHSVRDAGGVYLSTAVDESYGYTIAEAIAVHLPIVSFEVGALSEHRSAALLDFVPVGDNVAASEAILNLRFAAPAASIMR
jgi:glycosyltransferase involved in cell wall biosynthesis